MPLLPFKAMENDGVAKGVSSFASRSELSTQPKCQTLNDQHGTTICMPIADKITSKNPPNADDVWIFQCKARSVGPKHDRDEAVIRVPKNAAHGTALRCCIPECSASGRVFLWCSICKVIAAKRNFPQRHNASLCSKKALPQNQELLGSPFPTERAPTALSLLAAQVMNTQALPHYQKQAGAGLHFPSKVSSSSSAFEVVFQRTTSTPSTVTEDDWTDTMSIESVGNLEVWSGDDHDLEGIFD